MVTERKPPAKRRKPAPTALERARDAKPFDSFLYLMELGNALPDDEVARMPVDGAEHCDDYLEGIRKDPTI
jgi:hypothetical protein